MTNLPQDKINFFAPYKWKKIFCKDIYFSMTQLEASSVIDSLVIFYV